MIWNAPIWLNKLLVKGINILISLSILFCVIFIIYLLRGLYYKFKSRGKFNEYFTKKTLIIYLCGLVMSINWIVIFYYPKEVLPNHYNFDKVSISVINNSISNKKELVITDENNLDELKNILRKYKCVRSFDTGNTTGNDGEIVFIRMNIESKGRESLLNVIIKKDYQRVYTMSNIDFIYVISNKDGMLDNKIFDFVDGCLQYDNGL